MKTYEYEVDILYKLTTAKQKELLINLLTEEKDNIEQFIIQNGWVEDRVNTINSILDLLNYKN